MLLRLAAMVAASRNVAPSPLTSTVLASYQLRASASGGRCPPVVSLPSTSRFSFQFRYPTKVDS
jgi:hypothetical protein